MPAFEKTHRRRSTQAFTLIELLVVISIVAMLVAILLPVLAKARRAAQDVQCLSQERQTAISVLTYVNDFKNAVPIHWGRPVNNPAGTLIQETKKVDNRWMRTAIAGKTRAGLTYPYYNSGRTFYCPADEAYKFNNANINVAPQHLQTGLVNYPNTGWYSGQFFFSYLFPAVDNGVTTNTNYGAAWTGVAPAYWATTNASNSYGYFKNAMIPPTMDRNLQLNNPMLWDRNNLHERRIANVAYWDGSARAYPHHDKVYAMTSEDNTRGMTHKNIVTWLRRWRTEGFEP